MTLCRRIASKRRRRIKISKLSSLLPTYPTTYSSLGGGPREADGVQRRHSRPFEKTAAKHIINHTPPQHRCVVVDHFRTSRVLQKYSCYYPGVVYRSATPSLPAAARSPLLLSRFPHVSHYYSTWRHVATGVPKRRGHDFVVRSHLIVVFVGRCRLLGHQYVHQRIFQHQQQSNDPGKLRVPTGARRQLWRTALLYSATKVPPGCLNEPVHDTTQSLRGAHNNR